MDSSRNFLTIVSGLPRSGTSLMMQMLVAGGIPPITDDLRPPDENNPRGYLEFEKVKQLRADQSWVAPARGHVVKIIHLLLRDLPHESGCFYRVIFMRRPLPEIIASQSSMLARGGKTGVNPETLTKIFQAQLDQTEAWLAQQEQFKVLPIDYHRVIQQPEFESASINQFLGGGLDLKAMTSAVDPSLWRERKV